MNVMELERALRQLRLGGISDILEFRLCQVQAEAMPVPPGPRNDAASRLPTNAPVARSNTRLRFIFGLKVKSKLSRLLSGSRKTACFGRRSSRRSARRVSSFGDQTREQVDGVKSHLAQAIGQAAILQG